MIESDYKRYLPLEMITDQISYITQSDSYIEDMAHYKLDPN